MRKRIAYGLARWDRVMLGDDIAARIDGGLPSTALSRALVQLPMPVLPQQLPQHEPAVGMPAFVTNPLFTGQAHAANVPTASPTDLASGRTQSAPAAPDWLARRLARLGSGASSGDIAAQGAAMYDRHALHVADVRRGVRVELKAGAPERFREDAPGRILLPGSQGVIDEDAACVNPFVVWDGGAGRMFFHVDDLLYLQLRRPDGGRRAGASGSDIEAQQAASGATPALEAPITLGALGAP